MKKIKLLMTTIVAFLFCLSFISAQEVGKITNVSIAADGTISYTGIEGDYEYWVGINGNSTNAEDGIFARLEEHCTSEELAGQCKANYAGTYAFELYAYDGNEVITSYYAILNYDGETFSLTELERSAYLIVYYTDGGNQIDWEIVRDGERAHKPSDPQKEGYVFGGWYVDEELEYAFDFDTQIFFNQELYAKWEDPVIIDGVEITGIVKPVEGEVPNTDDITITTEGITIRNVNWYQEGTDWDQAGPATIFEAGKRYILVVAVENEDGYVFDEEFDDENIITDAEYLLAEFVNNSPDFRLYYDVTSKPKKPTLFIANNVTDSPLSGVVDFYNGEFIYELGIDSLTFIINDDDENPQYSVDGYAVYEVDGDKYSLVGEYEMGAAAEIGIPYGACMTFVARTFVIDESVSNGPDKMYSEYSNTVVIDNTKPATPKLMNPYGTYVDVNENIYI